eukprot:NODE_1974_length_1169_cov_78.865643_g1957_i0.p1 GENE.NODE_1974_length_1169_cov_78.865643_g1957_i0~~NODE_1974_length_1169_cov_78.865643_g1957_i0.p1  ORF type:complete len:353 (+),score=69.43 NODE_1974_length_1169_cov_78.865643_g1957_i0:105-1163(+)
MAEELLEEFEDDDFIDEDPAQLDDANADVVDDVDDDAVDAMQEELGLPTVEDDDAPTIDVDADMATAQEDTEPGSPEGAFSMYFDSQLQGGMTKRDFSSQTKLIGSFSTLEEAQQEPFGKYTLFDGLPLAELKKFNIRVFRAGIAPVWEDPANKDGGALVFFVRMNMGLEQLGYTMEKGLRALIGGEYEDLVTGIVLHSSPKQRGVCLEVWLRKTSGMEVGFPEQMGAIYCPECSKIHFKNHGKNLSVNAIQRTIKQNEAKEDELRERLLKRKREAHDDCVNYAKERHVSSTGHEVVKIRKRELAMDVTSDRRVQHTVERAAQSTHKVVRRTGGTPSQRRTVAKRFTVQKRA